MTRANPRQASSRVNPAPSVADDDGGGGFPTSEGWTKVTSWEQGATPTDPNGIGTTGTGIDDNGRLTVKCANHTSTLVGYQQGLLRITRPLDELFTDPPFDPETDVIEVGVDMACWPHSNVAGGVYFGVQDSDTVDANLGAAIGTVRHSAGSVDQSGLMTTVSVASTSSIGLVEEAYLRLEWSKDSANNWLTHMSARYRIEDGRVMGGASSNTQILRAATVADWRLAGGMFHGSTLSLQNITVGVDYYVRRLIKDPVDIPQQAAGTKVTSGTLNVLILGDSIADGQGQDPTGDGSNGLAYGGSAVPAGVAFYDDGVLQANWPDNGTSPPGPGYCPHIAETALAAGFSQVNIYRWAVASNTTATVRNTRFYEATHYLAGVGVTPDLVVPVTGTNDGQTGEAAGFLTEFRLLCRQIERAWPSARICAMEPGAVQGFTAEEMDAVRGHIQTVVGEKATRSRVSGATDDLVDVYHPTLTGYRTRGRLIIPAYLAAG